jgi:outer membrane protein assembly factor BamA
MRCRTEILKGAGTFGDAEASTDTMFRGKVSAKIGRWLLKYLRSARGRRAVLCALGVALGTVVLAWGSAEGRTPRGQAAQNGASRLESVMVTGSVRFTSAQIATAIGLKRGEMVQREDLQGAADKLAELGLFSNIQYRFSTEPTGLKVTYEVSDAPLVPVTFDNFLWLTDEELSGGLKNSGILFDGKAPLKGTVLDAMSEALMKLLDAHGVHARVIHEAVTIAAEDRTIQQFRVGDADLTVQAVEFSDALAKNDRAIQDRLPDIVGKPYSRNSVELFEFEQVRPIYFAHAYLQVQF